MELQNAKITWVKTENNFINFQNTGKAIQGWRTFANRTESNGIFDHLSSLQLIIYYLYFGSIWRPYSTGDCTNIEGKCDLSHKTTFEYNMKWINNIPSRSCFKCKIFQVSGLKGYISSSIFYLYRNICLHLSPSHQ